MEEKYTKSRILELTAFIENQKKIGTKSSTALELERRLLEALERLDIARADLYEILCEKNSNEELKKRNILLTGKIEAAYEIMESFVEAAVRR